MREACNKGGKRALSRPARAYERDDLMSVQVDGRLFDRGEAGVLVGDRDVAQGKDGRMGRSIMRAVRVAFSEGRASRLR